MKLASRERVGVIETRLPTSYIIISGTHEFHPIPTHCTAQRLQAPIKMGIKRKSIAITLTAYVG